jgi:hypothetical protein
MLNIHDIASDVGCSADTAKRWLSILEKSDVIFYLRPYSNNLLKRTVKSVGNKEKHQTRQRAGGRFQGLGRGFRAARNRGDSVYARRIVCGGPTEFHCARLDDPSRPVRGSNVERRRPILSIGTAA